LPAASRRALPTIAPAPLGPFIVVLLLVLGGVTVTVLGALGVLGNLDRLG
jgi:hypothetical protein